MKKTGLLAALGLFMLIFINDAHPQEYKKDGKFGSWLESQSKGAAKSPIHYYQYKIFTSMKAEKARIQKMCGRKSKNSSVACKAEQAKSQRLFDAQMEGYVAWTHELKSRGCKSVTPDFLECPASLQAQDRELASDPAGASGEK